MTQWYQPRQVLDGPNAGKWHYTCSNTSGTRVYPVGACAKDCPGHDDAEGAERHYVEGIAAGELRERDDAIRQEKCGLCGDWTQHRAMLWDDPFHRELPVCAGHDIRAHLRTQLLAQYALTD